MAEPRNFGSKRNRARRWIAERALELVDLPGGKFRIIGPGIDIQIADLALLRPSDISRAPVKVI